MKRTPRVLIATAVVAAAATALAACGGGSSGSTPSGSSSSNGGTSASTGYGAAINNVVNASSKTGGTLKLLTAGDCDSWDPARTYYGWCFNMQRLFTRGLTGYSKVNGGKFTLAPDLATSLGTHNSDYTQWSFTLKSGLKFSTGAPIRPIDVKYGIERLFATDIINGGPSSYFINTISHPKNYAGPYKDGDLSSIKTTSTTITFNLSTPYADFPYILALPAAAPVPYQVEGGKSAFGATYTKMPVSSGPFKIQSYKQNNEIVFVRNPDWSQSTDTIRHPLVNEVDLRVDTNDADIDNQLKSGQVDARADNGVSTTFQSAILTTPSLKENADDPITPFTRYMAVVPSVIPNIHCRLAVFYAFDKAGALRAYGGSTAGTEATSMTPPGITGYDKSYDPYPSGSGFTGDDTKAKQELQQCGKPSGFSTKFAYNSDSSTAKSLFQFEQQALGKVGIKVTAATANQDNYYSNFIGSPANLKNQGIGIATAAWGPDFPTPYGFFNSITNGANILPTGNSNYASLASPTVDKLLDAAPKGALTDSDWADVNKGVMASATYLPFIWGATLYYRNPAMTNVTSDNALAFGIYDFVNVGLS